MVRGPRTVWYCVERDHEEKISDIRGVFETQAAAQVMCNFLRHHARLLGVERCKCKNDGAACPFVVTERIDFIAPLYAYIGLYYHEGIINNVVPRRMMLIELAGQLGYKLSRDGEFWLKADQDTPNAVMRVLRDDFLFNMDWFVTDGKKLAADIH